jgi:uncharacterized protein YjiS (DUF1127 family)
MFLHYVDLARKAISAHLRYLNAIRELNALTDRELEDLGISRIEIEYAARTSSYRHLNTE